MPQKFYTLEIAKFKKDDVAGILKEKLREYNLKNREVKKKNVDWERTKNNQHLAGPETYQEAKDIIENLIPDSQRMKNGEVKKNLNLLLGINISASPSYFFKALQPPKNLSDEEKEIWQEQKNDWWDKLNPKSKDPKKALEDKKAIAEVWKTLDKKAFEDWKKIAVEFTQREEFKDTTLTIDLHMDEKRPHMELMVTPVVNGKFNCNEFWTFERMNQWRSELATKYASLGLEQTREEGPRPPISDSDRDKALHLDELEKTPPAPAIAVPKIMYPKDLDQQPIPLTNKVLIDKAELKKLEDRVKERETAQGEKYNFYKSFYIKNSKKLENHNKISAENKVLKKENKIMKERHKRLSDERMEDLRQIPLVEVLQNLGYEVKKEGKDFYRVKTEELNLVINEFKNSFSENKNSINGFGGIDLLNKVFGYSYKQSIEFLSGKFPPEQITKTIIANPKLATDMLINTVEKINEEPPKPLNKNINFGIDYLVEERGIDKSIVRRYVEQGLIYADNKKNLVITNLKKTFAVVRGTVKLKDNVKNTFKCNKGKMDFIKFQNTEEPKNLYVFESAIDSLAYQTLNPAANGLFVSTNGNAMINQLSELNIENFQTVVACFDNDDQGKKFTDKLKSLVSGSQKFEVHTPKNKDFTEDTEEIYNNKKVEIQNVEPEIQNPTTEKTVQKLRFGKK